MNTTSIKEHYLNPLIKSTISRISNSQLAWCAGVAGHNGWWKRRNGTQRLYNLAEDYDEIIQVMDRQDKRSLHQTLNYFRKKDNKKWISKKKYEELKRNGKGFMQLEETDFYMLSADMDLKGDYTVNDPIGRVALETGGTYFKNRFHGAGITDSLYINFSGNGIYFHIHPEIWLGIYGKTGFKNSEYKKALYMEMVIRSFNKWLADVEKDFYEEYPWCKRYCKVDGINNKKRQIKTIFSIHKKLDYAVIPISCGNGDRIKIPLEDAKLPLKKDVIKTCHDTYMVKFNAKEADALLEMVKPYLEETYNEIIKEKSYYHTHFKSNSNSKKQFNSILDLKTVCPFTLKVYNGGFVANKGGTRASGYKVSYEACNGVKDGEESHREYCQRYNIPVSNTYHLKKDSIVPDCSTINSFKGVYPALTFGDVHSCKSCKDELCKYVNNPLQYQAIKQGARFIANDIKIDGRIYGEFRWIELLDLVVIKDNSGEKVLDFFLDEIAEYRDDIANKLGIGIDDLDEYLKDKIKLISEFKLKEFAVIDLSYKNLIGRDPSKSCSADEIESIDILDEDVDIKKEIIDFVNSDTDILVVKKKTGSGKTTSIAELIRDQYKATYVGPTHKVVDEVCNVSGAKHLYGMPKLCDCYGVVRHIIKKAPANLVCKACDFKKSCKYIAQNKGKYDKIGAPGGMLGSRNLDRLAPIFYRIKDIDILDNEEAEKEFKQGGSIKELLWKYRDSITTKMYGFSEKYKKNKMHKILFLDDITFDNLFSINIITIDDLRDNVRLIQNSDLSTILMKEDTTKKVLCDMINYWGNILTEYKNIKKDSVLEVLKKKTNLKKYKKFLKISKEIKTKKNKTLVFVLADELKKKYDKAMLANIDTEWSFLERRVNKDFITDEHILKERKYILQLAFNGNTEMEYNKLKYALSFDLQYFDIEQTKQFISEAVELNLLNVNNSVYSLNFEPIEKVELIYFNGEENSKLVKYIIDFILGFWNLDFWIEDGEIKIKQNNIDEFDKVVIADATADHQLIQLMFPLKKIKVIGGEWIYKNTEIVQFVDGKNPKASMKDRNVRFRKYMRIKHILKKYPDKRFLIATHKRYELELSGFLKKDCNNFENIHFFASRSANDYRNMDGIIILGDPEVTPKALKELGQKINQNKDYDFENREKQKKVYNNFINKLGHGRYVEIDGYKDKELEKLAQYYRDNEIIQIIGRIRPDQSDKKKYLFLFNSRPIYKIIPDKLCTWKQYIKKLNLTEKAKKILDAVFAGNRTTTEVQKHTRYSDRTIRYWLKKLREASLLELEKFRTQGGGKVHKISDKVFSMFKKLASKVKKSIYKIKLPTSLDELKKAVFFKCLAEIVDLYITNDLKTSSAFMT